MEDYKLINKRLLDFKYYLNNLSSFMKQSYGISEHGEIFFQQLAKVNDIYENLFHDLDFIRILKDENDERIIITPENKLLDKIGAIFNCRRNFTIYLSDNYEEGAITAGYHEVNLSDDEFLAYIKCQIVKQNFDGNEETLAKLYATYIDGKLDNTDKLLPDFAFVYNNLGDAQCNLYWCKPDTEPAPSVNLKYLFYSGNLTIESMGIGYGRSITTMDDFGIFLSYGDTPSPDSNEYRYKFYNPNDPNQRYGRFC